MSRWFRFYDDVINDHKVQSLPDALFKSWVNILCIAAKNDGQLPVIGTVAFLLRVSEAKALEIIVKLERLGLIDKGDTGFVPHNWAGRQFKSDRDDTAPQRSKRYRDAKRDASSSVTRDAAVTVTRDVTQPSHPPETDTETDTQSEKKRTRASALADPWIERDRDRFWEQYPNKVGKADAMKALDKASRKVAPDELFRALQAYANKTDDRPFCNPATWLNQERWLDKPAMNANGQRGFNPSNRPSSNDFFAGMRSVAEDIVGDGEPSRPAYEDIPRGRVNIEH